MQANAYVLRLSACVSPINQCQHTGTGMGSNDRPNIRCEDFRLREPLLNSLL